MPSISYNPYFNLTVIRNPEMFFGRGLLLRRLYEAIVNRQSVSLIGPRSIGKSSFLWFASLPQAQMRFPYDLSRHLFVFLDLREYLSKTSEDFFHSVSMVMIEQAMKCGLRLQAERIGEEEFSSVLDQIAEEGFFPVLLLDSFDKVTLNEHFGLEFFEFLRAEASRGLVSYVTASIAPLYEVAHQGIVSSPFFNIFYNYHLEALTSEEAQELIRVPAQKVGIPFTEEEVAWVVRMAGRHPFFIQRVCYILFNEKMQRGKGEVDVQLVRDLAYKDLKPHFQDTWDRLTANQRAALQDEILQKDRQYRNFPELSESAFFRQFVRYTSWVGSSNTNADELQYDAAYVIGRIKNLLEWLLYDLEVGISNTHNSSNIMEELFYEFTSFMTFKVLKRKKFELFSLFLIDTGVAFENLQLPNPLLILASNERVLSDEAIEQMRRLLFNQYNISIALLLLFTDAKALSQTKQHLHKILHNVHALDVVALSQRDLLDVVSAKEPEGVLRRKVLSQVNLTLVAPYTITGPTPPHFFFGREHELREIAYHANKVSYIIVGGRRIGKTSIMSCLHHTRLPAAGFRTVYHDCSMTPSYEDFLRANLIMDDWRVNSSNNLMTFGELFKKIPNDKPLVLLLDEIDRLLSSERMAGWPLFNALRSLINSGRMQVVLSGERTLSETLRDSSGPLYNFGSELLISRLDKPAIEELVVKPMKHLEIELIKEKAIVNYIWDFSSGHPNVVQRLCRRLVELLNNTERRRITLNDVKEVVQDPKFQREDFLDTYWEKATLLERIISLLMARTDQQVYSLRDIHYLMNNQLGLVGPNGQNPSAIEVDNALNRLTGLRGILRLSPQGYMFDVPAFPRVVARSDVVTIDDFFYVYKDSYKKHGDLTLDEIIVKESEP